MPDTTPLIQRLIDKRPAVVAGLLIAATFLAYLPALRSGFIWDDDDYVTQNENLRDRGGLYRTWFEPQSLPQYYPLVHTTFWAEYQLWGLHPTGYHVVNVMIHALSAVALWLILKRLRLPWSVALLSASIFALHPVHVESVAWVTERKNVLSGLCYLLALWAYLHYDTLGSPRATGHGRWWWLALLLFVMALLSKSVTASWPAAVLLLVYWQRGRITRRDVLAVLPFFVIGAAFGIYTAHLEQTHVGARGAEFDFSILERCLIAGRAVWFYAGKIVWPHPLIFIYTRWAIDAADAWAYLYPGAALALVVIVLLWHRRRLNTVSPHQAQNRRGVLVALLFFGGTLLPAIGFLNVYPFIYSFVADHFQYHASLGLIVLLSAAVIACLDLPGVPTVLRSGVPACIVLGLAVLTFNQTHCYFDIPTLWQSVIARNPDASIAYNNLGVYTLNQGDDARSLELFNKALEADPKNYLAVNNLAYLRMRAKDYAGAVELYRKALKLAPRAVKTYTGIGWAYELGGDREQAAKSFEYSLKLLPDQPLAHARLAVVLAKQHDTRGAIDHAQQAIKLKPNDLEVALLTGDACTLVGDDQRAAAFYRLACQNHPDSVDAHARWARVMARLGHIDEAITAYRQALALYPGDADLLVHFADALVLDNKPSDAVTQYEKALALVSDNLDAHVGLGTALLSMGKLDDAIAQMKRCVELEPDKPEHLLTLASTYAQAGRLEDAAKQYTLALKINDQDATAHGNLGAILAMAGQSDKAIEHYRRALELNPDFADAHNNLGVLLMDSGRYEEASAHLQRAVEINPSYTDARMNLGDAMMHLSRYAQAAEQFTQVLKLQPGRGEAILRLARAWVHSGQVRRGVDLLNVSLGRQPNWPAALDLLARTLAACPDDAYRNPAQALAMAQRACELTHNKEPTTLDTLAIALAADGQFTRAVTTAQEAKALAEQLKRTDLAHEIDARIALYQSDKPFITDKP